MAMMNDDGDDGLNKKRRRQMILATLSTLVAAPLPVLSKELDKGGKWNYRTLSKRSYDDSNVLETINWSVPKSRGLNTERMADGINDSIKETSWLVTGMGRPEYFVGDFYFKHADYIPLMGVRGYENYCHRVRNRHRSEDTSSFDLICCSVTSTNEITTLWRYSCKYSELVRIREGVFKKWKKVYVEESKVYQTVFKTSDEDDGLIVSATEKVIIKDNAPDADTLRSKCNWYKCSID